nr:hypothetical protein [Nanoarchaeum sp.]
MKEYKLHYLKEPLLLFDGGESLNPCIGLIKYGPRFAGSINKKFREFKIGIIGSQKSILSTRQLFESFETMIYPKEEVKPWKIPFPGVNANSKLKFRFIFNPEWESEFTEKDFIEIKKANNASEVALDKIEKKLKIIYEKETPPDIIIVSIPEEFYKLCSCSQSEKPFIKVGLDDFHNRVKIIAMQNKIPTQLIRPETYEFTRTQERCLVAWNLVVGMLYKCQRGHPWKLTHLEENTCYVGISFFEEKGKKTRRASLAQIFLDTGESFVLRGESFKWTNIKSPKSPHLSKEDAKNLISYVINYYEEIRKKKPERIVIHKSSNFWDDELEGFKDGTESIKKKDFITILDSPLKLYTGSEYPVLRGTLLTTSDPIHTYLFSTGFVPSLKTYPGYSVPKPLQIKPFNLDSDIRLIAKEILAFTKLDWNNTFVYSRLPVTISISRKVGAVMAETEAQKLDELDSHYYFYM